MTRLVAGLGIIALAAGLWRAIPQAAPLPAHRAAFHVPIEAAPLCPWREPERDLRRFFPTATATHEDLLILSHLRLDLMRDLGRPLAPEEMLLRPFRVARGHQPLGTVLLRRVKGEFGAIELVLAVAPEGRVRGLRLQRLREPEAVAAALTAPVWLGAFRGKSAASPLRIGVDLPPVSGEAHRSATAVADGVRSLLILLRAAEKHGRVGGRAA